MNRRAAIEDVLILALFFLLLYTATYLIVNYPTIVHEITTALESRYVKLGVAIIVLPLSIVLVALGIRIVFTGVYRGKPIAVGFIAITIGVALFLFSMYTLIDLIWHAFKGFIEKFFRIVHKP